METNFEKSQGQTIEHVRIYLSNPSLWFRRRHLHVAKPRAGNWEGVAGGSIEN